MHHQHFALRKILLQLLRIRNAFRGILLQFYSLRQFFVNGVLGKLHVAALGDLVEIAYGKKKFPLSKFSFADDEAEAIAIEVEAFDDFLYKAVMRIIYRNSKK